MANQKPCRDCWLWEYTWSNDANERYGTCSLAYEGFGEAYPWSNVLIKLTGPAQAKAQVSASVLTHEQHSCDGFIRKTGT